MKVIPLTEEEYAQFQFHKEDCDAARKALDEASSRWQSFRQALALKFQDTNESYVTEDVKVGGKQRMLRVSSDGKYAILD